MVVKVDNCLTPILALPPLTLFVTQMKPPNGTRPTEAKKLSSGGSDIHGIKIGASFSKQFKGHGMFVGTVVAFNKPYFKVGPRLDLLSPPRCPFCPAPRIYLAPFSHV